MKSFGAVVTVEQDLEAYHTEGRTIIETVQIENVVGIGHYPMSPIAAAEAMRKALSVAGKMVKDKHGNFVPVQWIKPN